MKIVPVCSGKGGVGKTTFALNFALALARLKRTVLVDLDTGTSSLRNCLKMEFPRDLYHFLKKGDPIASCLTPLDESLDPDGHFRNFKIVASPRNFIHDIVNFSPQTKARLIEGINAIAADYVVIDMKAGLDYNVIDFLPLTNTGVILFTPQVRAATITASEMAKAILLRVMRMLFFPSASNEKYFLGVQQNDPALFSRLIDLLEDTYKGLIRNYDEFLRLIEEYLQPDAFTRKVRRFVEQFKVYFVLNEFDSVEQSAANIIRPFVENLYRNVTAKLSLNNLGWVVHDDAIRRSTEEGVPFLVQQHYQRKKKEKAAETLDTRLRDLLGVRKSLETDSQKKAADEVTTQVDILKRLYTSGRGQGDSETNFQFIAERVRAVGVSSVHDLGMRRICSEAEFLQEFYAGL